LTIIYPAVLSLPHAIASEGAFYSNPSDDQGPKRVRRIVQSECSIPLQPRLRIPRPRKGDWLDWDRWCSLGMVDADWDQVDFIFFDRGRIQVHSGGGEPVNQHYMSSRESKVMKKKED